jgi:PAS domain S-box-containing protein
MAVDRSALPPDIAEPTMADGEMDFLKRSAGAARAFETVETRFHYEALDAIPGHILILEARRPGFPIVFANRSSLRDYGYGWSEMIGLPLASVIAPASVTAALEQLRQLGRAGTGGDVRMELSALRRNGSQFIAGVTFAPLEGAQGEIAYLVCSGRDITALLESQRKRQELQEQLYSEMRERERIAIELRLAQKLESVGRLAAGIAHEINTPTQYVGDGVYFLKSAVADLQQLLVVHREAVHSLAGGAQPDAVLARLKEIEASFNTSFLDTEIPAAFERTREGIERVTAIVRAMREFAHPDTQQHAPADINHAIETTLLVARNEYKYTASVVTELAQLPPVVCNVGELNQVFLNLIVNAAHAIEAARRSADTGMIRISTLAVGQRVRIVLEDNGCGIAHENLERIFDPFYTTKEVGKGTGQGLAIARSIIVEKHGGTIDVESTVGVGTRMTLELPLRDGFAGGAG